MHLRFTFLLAGLLGLLGLPGQARQAPSAGPITVALSEPYELANVILALTPYGQQDPYEVTKNSRYYREVRAYFAPFAQHPLLAQVNYSRQQWDRYLSFRTDAYAFAFEGPGRLVRQFPFQAQDSVREFDDHLAQVEDFARVSDFRAFYRQHQPYYDSLRRTYQATQRLSEALVFLTAELGAARPTARYAIVLSPLVGRMNCHRTVAGVSTDFITLPEYVLNPGAAHPPSAAEVASGLHTFFTELDHGFVNPATEQYAALVRASFAPARWDVRSGYDGYEFGVFNEYMTWAVYDLFVYQQFPQVAAQVCQDWEMQNENRGFRASHPFHAQLHRLYAQRRPGQTIRNLYPSLLAWCARTQTQLSVPIISRCPLRDSTLTNSRLAHYELTFSEPMQPTPTVDIVHVANLTPRASVRVVTLTPAIHHLRWRDHGRRLSFDLELTNNCSNRVRFNVPWQTKTALRSRRGLDALPYDTEIKTLVRVLQ